MGEQQLFNCWYSANCKLDDCSENCLVYMQLKWQMDNSGLPAVKQQPIKLYITEHNEIDRDTFQKLGAIRRNIVDTVESGQNIAIVSNNTGNGKTSWAIKMLQTYLHYTANGNYENLKGMFVSVPELLMKLKDFNNPLAESYKERLRTVDLVVWDEIALTGVSQYDYAQLYVFIETRILHGKSNIFTCNYANPDDLERILGTRLASRVWNTSTIFELKGKDER